MGAATALGSSEFAQKSQVSQSCQEFQLETPTIDKSKLEKHDVKYESVNHVAAK